MAGNGITSKRVLIDKANSSLVAITAVAAFMTVFSLVASKTLFSQLAYQNRVLKEKHATVARLRSDIAAGKQLATSYKAFTTTIDNVLGGNPDGIGQQDGNNAKIVLDALPSNYDFPALATSLETLVTGTNGLKIVSITGTDDEVAQSANATSSSPTAVPIPFTIAVQGNYQAIQDFTSRLEHSIRPFQIQTSNITGDQSDLTLNLTAQTFYQPAKKLAIGSKVVK